MLWKTSIAALMVVVVVYGCDYLAFRLRHQPTGTVTVRRYLAIQEKANRVEYVFQGEQNQTCVHALFPHRGSTPCWCLARHSEQRVDI